MGGGQLFASADILASATGSVFGLTLFIIFFSEEGDPIIPVKGYLNPREIELYLKLIKKGDYFAFRSEDDFEKYKKYFRPKFRN